MKSPFVKLKAADFLALTLCVTGMVTSRVFLLCVTGVHGDVSCVSLVCFWYDDV